MTKIIEKGVVIFRHITKGKSFPQYLNFLHFFVGDLLILATSTSDFSEILFTQNVGLNM